MRWLIGTQPLPEIQAAQYDKALFHISFPPNEGPKVAYADTLSLTPCSVIFPGTFGSASCLSVTTTSSLLT